MQLQLWKRRDMKINNQGNLVLAQSKADNVSDCLTFMLLFLHPHTNERHVTEFKSCHQTVSSFGFLSTVYS